VAVISDIGSESVFALHYLVSLTTFDVEIIYRFLVSLTIL